MTRIETPGELRTAWPNVMSRLRRDLGASRQLSRDPAGTLERLGYRLGPDAERMLRSALPSRS